MDCTFVLIDLKLAVEKAEELDDESKKIGEFFPPFFGGVFGVGNVEQCPYAILDVPFLFFTRNSKNNISSSRAKNRNYSASSYFFIACALLSIIKDNLKMVTKDEQKLQ